MASNSATGWDILARELKFRDEEDMLRCLYETNSIPEIARMLKCGTATIHRRLEIYHIQKRKRGGPQVRASQRYKMFHVDQRLVMFLGLTVCSAKLKVSNSSLYKYKQWKQRKKIGLIA